MLSQSTIDVANAKVAHAWCPHALNAINQCIHQQTHLSCRGNMFLDAPSTDAVRHFSCYIFWMFCISLRRISVGTSHDELMNDAGFLEVRSIICHCARFDLHLTIVPASCYAEIIFICSWYDAWNVTYAYASFSSAQSWSQVPYKWARACDPTIKCSSNCIPAACCWLSNNVYFIVSCCHTNIRPSSR